MLTALSLAVIVLLIVAPVIALERCRIAVFKARFPPISDEEFMARCPAGTNPAVALKVRRILSDSLGVEYERIYPESSLIDDLDAG